MAFVVIVGRFLLAIAAVSRTIFQVDDHNCEALFVSSAALKILSNSMESLLNKKRGMQS